MVNEGTKKRRIVNKKIIGLLAALTLTTGLTVGTAVYDQNHFDLNDVEQEINIHTGLGETGDGHPISPYDNHGCELPGDDPFEIRLANKMREEGFEEATIEAAVQKFELKYDREIEAANEINLAEIEKQAKETKKGLR